MFPLISLQETKRTRTTDFDVQNLETMVWRDLAVIVVIVRRDCPELPSLISQMLLTQRAQFPFSYSKHGSLVDFISKLTLPTQLQANSKTHFFFLGSAKLIS